MHRTHADIGAVQLFAQMIEEAVGRKVGGCHRHPHRVAGDG